jgi:hypothetical protein
MKVQLQRYPLFLALVLMITLLASCSKEELVEPCGHTPATEEKSNGGVGGESGATNEAPGNGGDTGTEDAGISDDGDDLSGSERNKRKKPS